LNPSERGGMIVLDVPHGFEVSRELLAREIVIDYREKAGIRVAPHFYNTDSEVELVMDTIRDILDSGAWQKHDSQRTFVT
jgi:kynureninase